MARSKAARCVTAWLWGAARVPWRSRNVTIGPWWRAQQICSVLWRDGETAPKLEAKTRRQGRGRRKPAGGRAARRAGQAAGGRRESVYMARAPRPALQWP